jgi:ABC-type transport system involved in cytochrome c biogenesis permease subunit
MKRFLPLLVLLAGVALIGWSLRPPVNPGAFDVVAFGRLPVLAGGRLKPLDTVARNSLLLLNNSTSLVVTPDQRQLTPIEWLLDVCFHPGQADTYQTIAIDNPDVLSLFGLKHEDGRGGRRFSFTQLSPKLDELDRQAKLASPLDTQLRTPFQRRVLQLYGNLVLYQQLKYALAMPGQDDFLGELLRFQDGLAAGVAAVTAKQAGQPHDEAAVNEMIAMGEQFDTMANTAALLVVPPDEADADPTVWKTAGAALLETFRHGSVNPAALAYAGLAHAWRQNQPEQFNKLTGLYRAGLAHRYAPQLAKCDVEARFNAAAPFSQSMALYILAFFLAIFSWLTWPDTLGKSAFNLVMLAWLVATAGIAVRMWLEGRPPITNLYSSALFVGWGSVALCLALEAIYKNAIGSVAAGMTGFATLLIAHQLSFSGDTLEMMRAVLDSNFWLATHVVVVASGYSATFLAGFLAIIYIFRGIFTKSLDRATADTLARMVYGIVCFAMLFSFVGTVLGGIWADQSWGRFWGWDPKENGAVLIVIWNALILHARWAGLIKQRGLMCLAVFGNVVTSWSYFGTNMLGVGLHSYGFTDAAFWSLSLFVLSQLIIIALANLPLAKWRSFRRDAIAAPTGALPAK